MYMHMYLLCPKLYRILVNATKNGRTKMFD